NPQQNTSNHTRPPHTQLHTSTYIIKLITPDRFCVNATATATIYTLSLHDALPIYGHRRVHLLLRAEVAAELRCRHAPAPRLRGTGPRPLLGTHRALPAAVRGVEHDGGPALVGSFVLPPAAPPRQDDEQASAHRLHPEVDAAVQGRGELAGGIHLGPVPGGHRRRRCRCRSGRPGR